MAHSSRPGVNEKFEEYYSEIDPVVDGTIDEHKYKIYKIRNGHYSAYVNLPSVCICMIETGCLPPVPVNGSINFGPTDDGWIGFSTAEDTEYNYNKDWTPLPNDTRTEPKNTSFFDHSDVSRWTPIILESALTDWIKKATEEIPNINLQCSHNENK